MAQKISELSQLNVKQGDETFAVVQSGTTYKSLIATMAPAPRGWISSLSMTPDPGDTANDVLIQPGQAASTTIPRVLMELTSALTKRTDAPWAEGNNQGGWESGSARPTATRGTVHVFLIQRSDTGTVDVLFSLSPTSPTLPTNYDRSRRIGSLLMEDTNGLVDFESRDDEFYINHPWSICYSSTSSRSKAPWAGSFCL